MKLPAGLPQVHTPFDSFTTLSFSPPAWAEPARMGLEFHTLQRSRVWKGQGVAPGEGRGVLLIPGFMAGDGSLGTMAGWLKRTGYRPSRAGMRSNVDCSERSMARLEQRLERLADETGDRVSIVGQSRGGQLAKALGIRRPELVSGIVTLGSPLLKPYGLHPSVALQLALVASVGMGKVPGFMSWRCLNGDCCRAFYDTLDQPWPDDMVGNVGVFSRNDGIVHPLCAQDPDADEHVEVRSSHCGMAVHAGVYRAVHRALEDFHAAPMQSGAMLAA